MKRKKVLLWEIDYHHTTPSQVYLYNTDLSMHIATIQDRAEQSSITIRKGWNYMISYMV